MLMEIPSLGFVNPHAISRIVARAGRRYGGRPMREFPFWGRWTRRGTYWVSSGVTVYFTDGEHLRFCTRSNVGAQKLADELVRLVNEAKIRALDEACGRRDPESS